MKKTAFHLPIFLLLLSCLTSCEKSVPVNQANVAAMRSQAYDSQQRAIQYSAVGNADSAFAHFHKAKDLYIKAGDSIEAVYNLLNLSNIYNQYNDYAEMESVNTDAARYLNNPSDTIYTPIIYTNLGICYRNLHDYRKALDSYKKSLRLTKDPLRKAIIGNNMANVLIDSSDFAGAKKILANLSTLGIQNIDPTNYARITDNLGYAKYKLGDESGIPEMEHAYKLRQTYNDSMGQITSLLHLAKSVASIDTQRSINYATKAAAISRKSNSTDDELEALSFIVTHANDAQQAMAFSRRHVRISDSIAEIRQRAKNGFAAIKYESKSAHERVSKLEAEKQLEQLQQQRRGLIFIIVLLILVSGGAFLVLWLRIRHKKEKLRESYMVETRISKRVHDELANDVYHAMTFADTQDLSNPAMKETLLDSLDNIYNRTRDISSENSRIDTGDQFATQLKQMMAQYQGGGINVIANIPESVNLSRLDDVRKIAVYRIVQELLVNMKKHSNGNIAVFSFSEEKHMLNIKYSDNGQMDSDLVNLKNGLQNVENRINGINGTVIFDTNIGKGFRVSMSFPI